MNTKPVQTWAPGLEAKRRLEAWMEAVHSGNWAMMIERMTEQDLSGKTVLDFGCNRGGFLRQLYSKKPFAQGYGIDLDTEAIEIANNRKGDLPITFEKRVNLAHLDSAIDIAFSHEVLWLIEDMDQHAAQMAQALKPGGVYYAVHGYFPDAPGWEHHLPIIMSGFGLKPHAHHLYDIAALFRDYGFAVQAQKFNPTSFLTIDPRQQAWFSNMLEELDYFYNKVILRLIKSPNVL